MSILSKLFKNNKKTIETSPVKKVEEEIKFTKNNKILEEKKHFVDAPIAELVAGDMKEYTYEEAFRRVFARTNFTKALIPKDIEQFKTELILYSAGKLSPDTIVEKYNFGGRSFFTTNIIWGFYYYGFDFRTDHMRKIGSMPLWLKKKIKK